MLATHLSLEMYVGLKQAGHVCWRCSCAQGKLRGLETGQTRFVDRSVQAPSISIFPFHSHFWAWRWNEKLFLQYKTVVFFLMGSFLLCSQLNFIKYKISSSPLDKSVFHTHFPLGPCNSKIFTPNKCTHLFSYNHLSSRAHIVQFLASTWHSIAVLDGALIREKAKGVILTTTKAGLHFRAFPMSVRVKNPGTRETA